MGGATRIQNSGGETQKDGEKIQIGVREIQIGGVAGAARRSGDLVAGAGKSLFKSGLVLRGKISEDFPKIQALASG